MAGDHADGHGELTAIDHLPASGLEVIAATDDCVFARRLSGEYRKGSGPLMVYRPGGQRAGAACRIKLKGLGQCCIAGDGRITVNGDTFKQFDGESWRPCKGVNPHQIGVKLDTFAMIPGQNGWVLAFMGLRADEMKMTTAC